MIFNQIEMANWQSYSFLFFCWMAYLALHSVLASTKVKENIYHHLSAQAYRLVYNLFATVGLLIVILLCENIQPYLLFNDHWALKIVALIMLLLGVYIIRICFRQYNLKSFLGLAKEPAVMVQHGILNELRHPIYLGTILIVIGYFLWKVTLAALITLICVLFYLPIGIYLEEKKLIKEFGQAYQQYKKTVPAIWPKSFYFLFKKTS